MATRQEHRNQALALIETAKGYGPSAAARLSVLAEAQVHATLALTADVEVQTFVTGATPPEDAPAPKRRATTRKAAPAKKADK